MVGYQGDVAISLAVYALGYHESAKILAANMVNRTSYADYEGYPIMFLYRHSLELYLKAMLYKAIQLQCLEAGDCRSADKVFSKHRLDCLLPGLKDVFMALEWSWDVRMIGMRSWDDFSRLIKEIDELDRNAEIFRYPVTKNGQYYNESPKVINVISFGYALDPILDVLDDAVSFMDDVWQKKAEVGHYLQELAKEWGMI